jgi:hypothetical protein
MTIGVIALVIIAVLTLTPAAWYNRGIKKMIDPTLNTRRGAAFQFKKRDISLPQYLPLTDEQLNQIVMAVTHNLPIDLTHAAPLQPTPAPPEVKTPPQPPPIITLPPVAPHALTTVLEKLEHDAINEAKSLLSEALSKALPELEQALIQYMHELLASVLAHHFSLEALYDSNRTPTTPTTCTIGLDSMDRHPKEEQTTKEGQQ